MKLSRIYYVSSLLNSIFKKERRRTERRKQPTMYSKKIKSIEINELNDSL